MAGLGDYRSYRRAAWVVYWGTWAALAFFFIAGAIAAFAPLPSRDGNDLPSGFKVTDPDALKITTKEALDFDNSLKDPKSRSPFALASLRPLPPDDLAPFEDGHATRQLWADNALSSDVDVRAAIARLRRLDYSGQDDADDAKIQFLRLVSTPPSWKAAREQGDFCSTEPRVAPLNIRVPNGLHAIALSWFDDAACLQKAYSEIGVFKKHVGQTFSDKSPDRFTGELLADFIQGELDYRGSLNVPAYLGVLRKAQQSVRAALPSNSNLSSAQKLRAVPAWGGLEPAEILSEWWAVEYQAAAIADSGESLSRKLEKQNLMNELPGPDTVSPDDRSLRHYQSVGCVLAFRLQDPVGSSETCLGVMSVPDGGLPQGLLGMMAARAAIESGQWGNTAPVQGSPKVTPAALKAAAANPALWAQAFAWYQDPKNRETLTDDRQQSYARYLHDNAPVLRKLSVLACVSKLRYWVSVICLLLFAVTVFLLVRMTWKIRPYLSHAFGPPLVEDQVGDKIVARAAE